MVDAPTSTTDNAVIHLIDTSTGRSVQTWKFAASNMISIGRGADCDVCISDPYVSRRHAELRSADGRWSLIAISKNGVFVNGQNVTEVPCDEAVSFRLGPTGPALKFMSSSQSVRELPTLAGMEMPSGFLPELNTAKRDEEVRGIMDSAYFKDLQDRARELRKQRENP